MTSKTTTQRGYGHRHQQVRKRLLIKLVDGSPCQWCGKPMFRKPEMNFDGAPLEADHTKDLKHHDPSDADRLLHRRCNRQRRDGQEHRRPGNDTEPQKGTGVSWSGLVL